jgi:hypothetical protein
LSIPPRGSRKNPDKPSGAAADNLLRDTGEVSSINELTHADEETEP